MDTAYGKSGRGLVCCGARRLHTARALLRSSKLPPAVRCSLASPRHANSDGSLVLVRGAKLTARASATPCTSKGNEHPQLFAI